MKIQILKIKYPYGTSYVVPLFIPVVSSPHWRMFHHQNNSIAHWGWTLPSGWAFLHWRQYVVRLAWSPNMSVLLTSICLRWRTLNEIRSKSSSLNNSDERINLKVLHISSDHIVDMGVIPYSYIVIFKWENCSKKLAVRDFQNNLFKNEAEI